MKLPKTDIECMEVFIQLKKELKVKWNIKWNSSVRKIILHILLTASTELKDVISRSIKEDNNPYHMSLTHLIDVEICHPDFTICCDINQLIQKENKMNFNIDLDTEEQRLLAFAKLVKEISENFSIQWNSKARKLLKQIIVTSHPDFIRTIGRIIDESESKYEPSLYKILHIGCHMSDYNICLRIKNLIKKAHNTSNINIGTRGVYIDNSKVPQDIITGDNCKIKK
jgi:hypothetical protein